MTLFAYLFSSRNPGRDLARIGAEKRRQSAQQQRELMLENARAMREAKGLPADQRLA